MQQTAIMKHWGLEPTQRTSTGEVIHTCGWLHPEGTPCPTPTISDPLGMLQGMEIGEQYFASGYTKEELQAMHPKVKL